MASTIFSHNAGVSCRENYDTVSSMKKKKKKEREREKKYNATAYESREPRHFVPRVSRDFHGKRIAVNSTAAAIQLTKRRREI